MNVWIAQNMSADYRAGGRFYIMERMWSPQMPRPPYAVGDEFRVMPGDFERVGQIIAVNGSNFDVEVEGVVLHFTPTPRGAPPPTLSSEIPFEDYVGQP